MPQYVVYHAGTGTFVSAEECVLIDVALLPSEFDEWEDFLSDNPSVIDDADRLA